MTRDQKAAALRTALIDAGIAVSPNPDMKFAELPEDRKERWRLLADAYIGIFGR